MNKCIKGESCLHCDTDYCRFKDEVAELKAENERLKTDIAIYKGIIDSNKEENERLKANKGRCAFKCLDNTFCPEVDKKITELELSRDSYKVSYETAKKYREKAEQALQEIRDIINAPCDNCKYNKDGITCSISDCGEGKLKIIENKINEVIGEK